MALFPLFKYILGFIILNIYVPLKVKQEKKSLLVLFYLKLGSKVFNSFYYIFLTVSLHTAVLNKIRQILGGEAE